MLAGSIWRQFCEFPCLIQLLDEKSRLHEVHFDDGNLFPGYVPGDVSEYGQGGSLSHWINADLYGDPDGGAYGCRNDANDGRDVPK